MKKLSWILGLLLVVTCTASGCNQPVVASQKPDPKVVAELREKLKAGAQAASGDSAEAGPAAATGWATIKGNFKLIGSAPSPAKINADKDVEVCAKHPLFDEGVVVGKDGELEGAVIFCRTPKVEVHESYNDSAGTEVVLDNKNCRFEPHVSVLRTSQTLLIKNSDPVGHNSKIDAVKNGAVNVLIPAGGATPQKLGTEEQLPVKVGCSIHPWMGGWVVVRSDPYAAASGKDGTFTLANVPAGRELEFQLWQEKSGFLKGVKCDQVKVDGKGRFKVKLEPGQELALEIGVPAESLK